MRFAQRCEVGQIGVSTLFPRVQMVDPTFVDRHAAVGMRTGGLHRLDRDSLVVRGEPFAPSLVEHDARDIEHDREDVGVARHPPHRLDRHGHAAVGLAQASIVSTAGERPDVDVDHQGRTRATSTGALGRRLGNRFDEASTVSRSHESVAPVRWHRRRSLPRSRWIADQTSRSVIGSHSMWV